MKVLIFVGFHDSTTTATSIQIALQHTDTAWIQFIIYHVVTLHTHKFIIFHFNFHFYSNKYIKHYACATTLLCTTALPYWKEEKFHLLYCVILFPRVLITHLYKAFLVFLALLQSFLLHIVFYYYFFSLFSYTNPYVLVTHIIFHVSHLRLYIHVSDCVKWSYREKGLILWGTYLEMLKICEMKVFIIMLFIQSTDRRDAVKRNKDRV